MIPGIAASQDDILDWVNDVFTTPLTTPKHNPGCSELLAITSLPAESAKGLDANFTDDRGPDGGGGQRPPPQSYQSPRHRQFSSLSRVPVRVIALLLNLMFGHELCPVAGIRFFDAERPAVDLRNRRLVVSMLQAAGYTGILPDPVTWQQGREVAAELCLWKWLFQNQGSVPNRDQSNEMRFDWGAPAAMMLRCDVEGRHNHRCWETLRDGAVAAATASAHRLHALKKRVIEACHEGHCEKLVTLIHEIP